MNIAVLIMATKFEPSLSNVESMRNTFIKYAQEGMKNGSLKNNYDFYVYYASDCGEWNKDGNFNVKKDKIDEHVYTLEIEGYESVYRTFEKTVAAYSVVNEYDMYVRINISTYINIGLLDTIASSLNRDSVYCNAINCILAPESNYLNELYPRGDAYIIFEDNRKVIVEEGEKIIFEDERKKNRLNVIHVDDVLTGICLINRYGNDCGKKYVMLNYNLFLRGEDEITERTLNTMCVFSRLKTIPNDASCSGFSWDDFPFRRTDGKKMEKVNDIVTNIDYKTCKSFPILVKPDICRKTHIVQIVPVNPYQWMLVKKDVQSTTACMNGKRLAY